MSFLRRQGITNESTMEVPMFAIIGQWRVDGALDSEQLVHIADNVRQQQDSDTVHIPILACF